MFDYLGGGVWIMNPDLIRKEMFFVWFFVVDDRHITFSFSVHSKNSYNSMFVFTQWKQWWLAGSLNSLYKTLQVKKKHQFRCK